jgi:membrane-bound ClpP family serine protease
MDYFPNEWWISFSVSIEAGVVRFFLYHARESGRLSVMAVLESGKAEHLQCAARRCGGESDPCIIEQIRPQGWIKFGGETWYFTQNDKFSNLIAPPIEERRPERFILRLS